MCQKGRINRANPSAFAGDDKRKIKPSSTIRGGQRQVVHLTTRRKKKFQAEEANQHKGIGNKKKGSSCMNGEKETTSPNWVQGIEKTGHSRVGPEFLRNFFSNQV